MYNLSRTGRERSTNIWPGFVDGLATLLLVLIFVLMVFMIGQFFLSAALSNRDTRLAELTSELNELSELLSLERQANANLRVDVSQLSSELQASLGQRDSLSERLASLTEQRDRLAGDLARLTNERDRLTVQLEETQTLLRQSEQELAEAQAAIQADRATIEAQLAEVRSLQELRDRLRTELADLELAMARAESRAEELAGSLAERSAELDTLRGQVASGESQRSELERQLAESRQRVADLETLLAERQETVAALQQTASSREAELARQIAAMEALRRRVEARNVELDALETELAAQARALTEAQDESRRRQNRIEELEAFLAEREDRLAALRDESAQAQAELARTQDFAQEQQDLGEEARLEVERLNRQLVQLREQLAALNAALEAAEALNAEQEVQIANLGQRLNAALATKVQELQRYRSEFFGRLREVLGDNPNVRIVGDRFVFQSEVLFNSASADLQPAGQEQIASLAQTLLEIAGRIPDDIDWVLRVDGHTDARPIATAQFPSNWELSTARAIEVVKFLIDQGLPADRLVAAGFADNYPIAEGFGEEALSRNRRIEFKLTER